MGAHLATCRDIARASANGASLAFALDLRLADTRVTVRSNCAALMEVLGSHYQDFYCDADKTDMVITAVEAAPLPLDLPFRPWPCDDDAAKEEFIDLTDGRIVRKRRTGLLLVFGPAGHFVIGPCLGYADQVINAINARFADRQFRAKAVLFHAASVCIGGAGLAIAGFAGAGKSTLALAIMRHGASFVSNDRLLIGPGPHGLVVTGIPRMPRVNPGTILHNDSLTPALTEEEHAAYARLTPQALWGLERKYDISIRDCFGPGRFRLRADLTALLVLGWRPGDGDMRASWTDIASRPDLLPAFMKDRGVFLEEGPRRAEAGDYLALLRYCPILVLEGGVDFHRAAALGLDVLRSAVAGHGPGAPA